MPAPVFATSHNGGRSECNMNYVPASGDYPFCNMMKWADPFWSMEDNNPVTPDKLNSDGYPITLVGTSGGVKVAIQTPTQLEKPGNWVLRWTGTGCQLDIGMTGGITTVSGNSTTSPWTFTPLGLGDFQVVVHVYNIGTGISNIELVHATDLADLDAGNIFAKKFRDTLKAANFGVIRFLNWQAINTAMAAQWRYRMPVTHWSWGANLFPPELYAGTTTNVGRDYSVTVPGTLKHSSDNTTWTSGDAPKDKDTISVCFNASMTEGPPHMTLKIGSGAAIHVMDITVSELAAAGNNLPLINGIATFVYDARLAVWFKWGGATIWFGRGIDTGVPPEVMLQLCAEIGAHPWVGFGPYTLDPMTDYATGLVDFVYANKNSWMIPRFEVSNELWNPGFYSTQYATAQAQAQWSSTNYHMWYGKVTSTLGQYVASKFGVIQANVKSQSLYQVCCAVQTATGNTSGSCQSSDERMSAAAYVGQAAAAQSPYTKSSAATWATHVTCANYFSPATYGVPLENTLAASLGAVRFAVTSCSGTSLVASLALDSSGGTMTSGMTLAGLGVPAGITITGTYPNFTMSSPLTLPAGWKAYAYITANYSALQDFIDTCDLPVVFNATTSGATMTVNSTTGPTTGIGSIQVGMKLTWAGAYSNSYITALGTGTGGTGTYTLDAAPASGAITNATVTGFWLFDRFYSNLLFTNWKAWAQGFTVQKMNFYEGGYSPDYSGGYTSAVSCLKYLSKFVASTSRKTTGLGGYTTDNYNTCTGISGGGFTAEFPSQYIVTGPYPSLQIWNMLETIYRSPNGPQFDAVAAYNQVAQFSIRGAGLRLHA